MNNNFYIQRLFIIGFFLFIFSYSTHILKAELYDFSAVKTIPSDTLQNYALGTKNMQVCLAQYIKARNGFKGDVVGLVNQGLNTCMNNSTNINDIMKADIVCHNLSSKLALRYVKNNFSQLAGQMDIDNMTDAQLINWMESYYKGYRDKLCKVIDAKYQQGNSQKKLSMIPVYIGYLLYTYDVNKYLQELSTQQTSYIDKSKIEQMNKFFSNVLKNKEGLIKAISYKIIS